MDQRQHQNVLQGLEEDSGDNVRHYHKRPVQHAKRQKIQSIGKEQHQQGFEAQKETNDEEVASDGKSQDEEDDDDTRPTIHSINLKPGLMERIRELLYARNSILIPFS